MMDSKLKSDRNSGAPQANDHCRTRSHAVATVALVLTALTGLAIGQLTILLTNDAVARPVPPGNREQIVRDFYDGLNRYLATGDNAVLQLLAPDFREFDSFGGTPAPASTMLARLDAFREGGHLPRYAIEQLRDFGTVIEVRMTTGLPSTFPNYDITVSMDPRIGPEFVWVDGKVIAGHWSRDGAQPVLDRLLDASVPLVSGSAVMFSISRVAFEPGGELELAGQPPFGILVEQGTVTISVQETTRLLPSGTVEWVASPRPAQIANLGVEPATSWVITIGMLLPNGGLTGLIVPPKRADVTITRVTWSKPYVWPEDPARIRLVVWRATLPPGAQLWAGQAQLGELLAVIDGSLDARLYRGSGFRRGPGNQSATIRDQTTIHAGQGFVAAHDATAGYRVAGSVPATMFVLIAEPVP